MTLNFPSDHRAVRLKLKISKRAKIDDAGRFNKRLSNTIPEIRVSLTKQYLDKELKRSKSNAEIGIQKVYKSITSALNRTSKQYSIMAPTDKIDNIIFMKTKRICEKRNKLVGRLQKSVREKIKLMELRELAKRMIRKDIKSVKKIAPVKS